MNKDFFDDFFDDDDELEGEPKRKPKTFTRGFVTALAVCLVAVGAAVWTTVSQVNSYLNPAVGIYEVSGVESEKAESRTTVSQSDARVNAAVSGVKADSDTDSEVRFNCEPIKNRKIIADYSEIPVYSETLGDYRAHTGIDYEAEIDDKVRAMGKGVVKDIYYDDLLGNVVVIEHSKEVSSYYCGLAKTALVQKGEVVSAGDFVGTVYAIPSEAAQQAHVHVEVKENGRYVDPRKFFPVKTSD